VFDCFNAWATVVKKTIVCLPTRLGTLTKVAPKQVIYLGDDGLQRGICYWVNSCVGFCWGAELVNRWEALQITSVLALMFSLSGCTPTYPASPEVTVTADTVEEREAELAEIEPKVSDFLTAEMDDYSISEGGGWLIAGYLSVRYDVTNVSDKPIYGFATTLRITDTSGEILFISNLNQELDIQPGATIGFGLFGDRKQPLLATVPQWKQLLDAESLDKETEISLEVRKILLSEGEILEFVSEIPSEELENEDN